MTWVLLTPPHCWLGTATLGFCCRRHPRPCQHGYLSSPLPLPSCPPFLSPLDSFLSLLTPPTGCSDSPSPGRLPCHSPEPLCCPFLPRSPTLAHPSLGAPCRPDWLCPSLCPQCPTQGWAQSWEAPHILSLSALSIYCMHGAECMWPTLAPSRGPSGHGVVQSQSGEPLLPGMPGPWREAGHLFLPRAWLRVSMPFRKGQKCPEVTMSPWDG